MARFDIFLYYIINKSMEIYNYLKQGLIVNIFYIKNRDVLKSQLLDYLRIRTKSLRRKHLTQKGECRVCEYRVYKVLTFLDCIRASRYYGVLLTMYDFPLIDYLVDYVTSGCVSKCDTKYTNRRVEYVDCVDCVEFDFFTHYAKNNLLDTFTQVKLVNIVDNVFKVTGKQEFPERYPPIRYVEKSSDIISSMMLLDFDRFYRVVSLRRIASKFGYSYVITLFDYIKHFNYIMINDFWLPKSCLPEIQGTKCVDNHGYLNVYNNQWIRVVGTNVYKGNKYVVIKSYVVKTLSQLRKPQ